MRIFNLIHTWIWSLLVLLSACNYNHLKQANPDSAKSHFQAMETPDFTSVQASIIGPKCLGCHSDATGNKGSANFETYQNVRRLMNRISFRALEKRDMPPSGPLSSDEMQILKNWLDSGAPESAVDPQSQGDPGLEQGPTDWSKINQKIFARKCLDCHSQPQPQAQLDLNSYDEVKAKVTVIFNRVIIQQDMPVDPYPALSMKERKVFLDWLNMGMPR